MQIESFLKKSRVKKRVLPSQKDRLLKEPHASKEIKFIPQTYRAWDYITQKVHNEEIKGTQKVHNEEIKGTQKVHNEEIKGTQKVHNEEIKGTQKVHNEEVKGTQKVHNEEIKGTQKVHNEEIKGTQKVHNEEIKGTQKVHNEEIKGTQKVHNEEVKGTQKVHNEEVKGTQKVHNEEIKGTQKVHNEEIKGTQKVHNEEIKGTQKVHNEEIKGTQKVHNEEIKGTQKVHNEEVKGTQKVHNEEIKGTQKVHNEEVKGTQKVHNEEIKGTQKTTSFFKLNGVQKKIILCLYNASKPNNFKTTDALTNADISFFAEVNLFSVKTSLQRLKLKGLLHTKDVKKGRGGWTKYTVKPFLIKELSLYNSNNNIKTITTIKEEEKDFPKNTSPLHPNQKNTNSSHNNSNFTSPLQTKEVNPQNHSTLTPQTTHSNPTSYPLPPTNKLTLSSLPPEWQSINYHLLSDLHFKPHHLVSLYKLNILDPETVQESINHFAYGIKNNPDNYKKYTDPLKVLIGRLRKGEQWTESTYKSPQELALEELKQKKKTEKKKLSDETCKLVEELEQENYQKWFYTLQEEEKQEIRQKHKRDESNIYSDYYNENIFKLHYAKHVMEEQKDPKELALQSFIEKKREQEKAEASRITDMLQKGGLTMDYYRWQEKLTKKQFKEITGETQESLSEAGSDKLKIYYGKQVIKKEQ